MPELLLALDWATDRPREIVIVGPEREDMLAVVRAHAPRNHVLIAIPEAYLAEVAAVAPIVEGKLARDGQATAYVCEQGRCAPPTTDPEELARQLGR